MAATSVCAICLKSFPFSDLLELPCFERHPTIRFICNNCYQSTYESFQQRITADFPRGWELLEYHLSLESTYSIRV